MEHNYTMECIYNKSFQNFSGFENFWLLKPPNFPGTWNIKQKVAGIDQSTLQCCYVHYVVTNKQTY